MNSDNGKSAMNNNSTFRTLYVRNPSLFDQFDTSTAGIDKLNILTKEFIVPTASRLDIDYYGRKANCEEATQERLFISEEGEQVEGRKAYYNGQGYALNINNYGLQLVFSPAKVLQPDRPFILPTDAGDIDNATNSVINRIKHDTGVLISTDVAKVCRIDIARQKALQRPIRDYLQAFTMLRLKGSRNKTRQYSHQTFQYNTNNEFPDTAQRLAVCGSLWSEHNRQRFESYSDYGQEIRSNAKRGIELNEKNGNKCATQTGKVRAQQLANGESISLATIKRMHSYLSRAETYYDNADDTSDCGYISYLLWGGKSALSWSRNKLRELGELEG